MQLKRSVKKLCSTLFILAAFGLFSGSMAKAQALSRYGDRVQVREVEEIGGDIWIASLEGLYTVDNRSLRKRFAEQHNGEPIPVFCVEEVGEGEVWFGTSKGIWRIASSGLEQVGLGDLNNLAVFNLAFDARTSTLYAIIETSVYRITAASDNAIDGFSSSRLFDSRDRYIAGCLLSIRGSIWLCMDDDLYRLRLGHGDTIFSPAISGHPILNVRHVIETEEGVIYYTAADHQADTLYNVYEITEKIRSGVKGMREVDGKIWYWYEGGVDQWDGQKQIPMAGLSDITVNITDIHSTFEFIWIGTSVGLFRKKKIEPSRVRRIAEHPTKLSIHGVMKSKSGAVWAWSRVHGLYRVYEELKIRPRFNSFLMNRFELLKEPLLKVTDAVYTEEGGDLPGSSCLVSEMSAIMELSEKRLEQRILSENFSSMASAFVKVPALRMTSVYVVVRDCYGNTSDSDAHSVLRIPLSGSHILRFSIILILAVLLALPRLPAPAVKFLVCLLVIFGKYLKYNGAIFLSTVVGRRAIRKIYIEMWRKQYSHSPEIDSQAVGRLIGDIRDLPASAKVHILKKGESDLLIPLGHRISRAITGPFNRAFPTVVNVEGADSIGDIKEVVKNQTLEILKRKLDCLGEEYCENMLGSCMFVFLCRTDYGEGLLGSVRSPESLYARFDNLGVGSFVVIDPYFFKAAAKSGAKAGGPIAPDGAAASDNMENASGSKRIDADRSTADEDL